MEKLVLFRNILAPISDWQNGPLQGVVFSPCIEICNLLVRSFPLSPSAVFGCRKLDLGRFSGSETVPC